MICFIQLYLLVLYNSLYSQRLTCSAPPAPYLFTLTVLFLEQFYFQIIPTDRALYECTRTLTVCRNFILIVILILCCIIYTTQFILWTVSKIRKHQSCRRLCSCSKYNILQKFLVTMPQLKVQWHTNCYNFCKLFYIRENLENKTVTDQN